MCILWHFSQVIIFSSMWDTLSWCIVFYSIGYGLYWTDEIDIDASEIWYKGVTRLNSDNDIFNYLKVVAEETNPDYIIKALDEIAKMKGMANVAKHMGIGRESLYKSLGGKSKPLFETIYKTLQALGYQLTIKPMHDEA